MSDLTVRPAGPGDAGLVLAFVRELAAYEKLSHAVKASEADIAVLLFGPAPRAVCELAALDGEVVGFSLWFYTVSTFAGRAGIWLEDLFVRPAARGHGAGRALLESLAKRCVAEGLARIDWAVLDWNQTGIGCYDRIGARTLDDWRLRRLEGDALKGLASGS